MDPLGVVVVLEQTALQHDFYIYMHFTTAEKHSMAPAWEVVRKLSSPTVVLLLPLQHLSVSLFASNRDQDVSLAAVDAAYKTRAIDCSRKISSSLGLNLQVFSLV